MPEKDRPSRAVPRSGVFCGPDKYLTLCRHSISEPMPPIVENDSCYLLIKSGRAALTVNGVRFDVCEGSVCWLNSNQMLTIEPVGGPVSIWSLTFDYQLFCYLMYRYSPMDLKIPAMTTSPVLEPCAAAERISGLFSRFDRIESFDGTICALRKVSVIGQISLIFNEENRGRLESFNAQPLPLCWHAACYLAVHSQEHITASDVAKQLHTDTETLNRQMLEGLGFDFQQSLNRNRCVLASSYFLCENLSLDCIAIQSGFSSVVTFYHIFKETMGMTPNEYRDMLLRGGNGCDRRMIMDDRIFLVIRYMFEHFTERVTLNSIAENTYVTPNSIRSLLKSTLGMSYKDILSQYRVRCSEALLTSTDLPLPEISVMSGFGSQRTFCRVFTAANGESPNSYRRRFRPQGGQNNDGVEDY